MRALIVVFILLGCSVVWGHGINFILPECNSEEPLKCDEYWNVNVRGLTPEVLEELQKQTEGMKYSPFNVLESPHAIADLQKEVDELKARIAELENPKCKEPCYGCGITTLCYRCTDKECEIKLNK